MPEDSDSESGGDIETATSSSTDGDTSIRDVGAQRSMAIRRVDSIQMEATLMNCQQSSRHLRRRIRCFWVALTLLTGLVLGGYKLVEHAADAGGHDDMRASAERVEHVFFGVRLFLLCLAPTATNVDLSRAAWCFDVVMFCVPRILKFATEGFGLPADLRLTIYYIRGAIFVASALWALRPAGRARAQDRMWMALSGYVGLSLLEKAVWYFTTPNYWAGHSFAKLWPKVVVLLVTLAPGSRLFLQRWLWRWLEGRAAAKGAASIACLIGQCEPSEVIATAKKRFRCISVDQLSPAVFDLEADLAQCRRAQSCILGHCDAFVSHSWHDCPFAKWKALQTWRQEFVAEHGRQPVVWFDRCCIDQSNIKDDLRCLPIFLKGCSSMVVLCGPTYLSRLWCILELFTYVQMGGASDEIRVVPVVREDSAEKDIAAVEDAIHQFDVRECECVDPQDQQRIVEVFEVAYGDMDSFNIAVKAIAMRVHQQMTKRS